MGRRNFLKVSLWIILSVVSAVLIMSVIMTCISDGENRLQESRIEIVKDSTRCTKLPMESDGIVRLSKVEVYPQYLEEYIRYAIEVGEVSLQTEPGVLTMYALQEKENHCMVTILETYASKKAYEAHIESEHFQKYKKETLYMVKELVLSDQIPLNPSNRINNFIQKD